MSCSATCWASVASGEFVVDLSAAVAQADRGNGALFRRFEGVGTTLDAHNAHVDALVGSGLVGRVLMWQKQKSACIVLFEAYLAASGAAGVAELIERAAASDTDRTDRADWSALFFDEGALSPAMGTSSHPQWRDIVCAAAGGEVVLARKAITPPQAVEVMQLVLANPAVQRLDLSYNVGCFGSDAAVAALCELVAGSTTLIALDVSGTAISPMAAMKLSKALLKNTTLRSVNLINCKNAGPVFRALLARVPR